MKSIKKVKDMIKDTDALLIFTGAGMSVESGIPTYRGTGGIWRKTINIDGNMYAYNEISSLAMLKFNPKLVWDFNLLFYDVITTKIPHKGYKHLLKIVKNKFHNNYFICTSNVDGYFLEAGFDFEKIYEMHGSIRTVQCFDKRCCIRNGIFKITEINKFKKGVPQCLFCNKNARPNISFFGDDEFYEKPYLHQRRRLDEWCQKNSNNNILLLEIGCGINPHSLRVINSLTKPMMLSNEWKIPTFIKNIIRINPECDEVEEKVIQIPTGVIKGLKKLF